VDDGLPQTLEDVIQTYGMRRLKIKLSGAADRDRARLLAIRDLYRAHQMELPAYTLDGNENYQDLAGFRALWEALRADPALEDFLRGLIFVEQPVHRDQALSEETGALLNAWRDRPPIIIDESDAELDSLDTALACGYQGTSHKNCKGVFKGLTNACKLTALWRAHPDRAYCLSGEDLSNLGPIALLQDLAVMACLGLEHLERNGQHYFRGLSLFPADVQAAVLAAHPDLYERHAAGFAALKIRDGRLELKSVLEAPFGYGITFDPTRFTPVADWTFASLQADADADADA
jgi:hypothetical protein